jgi:sugar phosphate isomerase/epimerase
MALDTPSRAAKDAGVRFIYHIHGLEFEASPEGTLFDTLATQTDPAHVAFQADVFWVRRGGGRPRPDETSVPLGEGMIDWPSVLRAAKKAGVERHFIEDEHPDALAQIPRSLKYLAALAS